MNKNESKYFNTAVKMDEALLTLLEKKDFAYITVKEICAAAGVNRSTFYLHYENTTELLKETTNYLLDKHFAYYDVNMKEAADRIERSVSLGEHARMLFITSEYLTPYLTFIKENRRVFKVAIKHFDTMNMNEVYRAMFKCVFEPILSSFGVPRDEQRYVIKFYLSGIFAIVTEWLETDCKEEIGFIVKVINDCVLEGRERLWE